MIFLECVLSLILNYSQTPAKTQKPYLFWNRDENMNPRKVRKGKTVACYGNGTIRFMLNMNVLPHTKKSREIIKQICNKHRLQKQISSIMKQNCFLSIWMKQFWFMIKGICFLSRCFCFDFLQCTVLILEKK